jgi:hypothetical protein
MKTPHRSWQVVGFLQTRLGPSFSCLHASVSGLHACLSFTARDESCTEALKCPLTELDGSPAAGSAGCKCAHHVITAVVRAVAVTAVMTAVMTAGPRIAYRAGQPCNLAIQSRNHFAVVEMEFRDDVNYLTTKCLLLLKDRSRNGIHIADIAAEGRFSDRAFSDPPMIIPTPCPAVRQSITPPHLEPPSHVAKTTPHIAE